MFKKYFSLILIFLSLFSFTFKSQNTIFNIPIKSKYVISSYYGYRTLYGKQNFHNGLDFACIENTALYPISDGIISYIGFDKNGYGNYIIILHNDSSKSIYGHLSDDFKKDIGDSVTKNDIIGYVGPKILSNGLYNGNTTGSHLHLTILNSSGKSIDPLSVLND